MFAFIGLGVKHCNSHLVLCSGTQRYSGGRWGSVGGGDVTAHPPPQITPVCPERRALALPPLLQSLHSLEILVTEGFQGEEGSLDRSPCRCLFLVAATPAGNCPTLILAALSRKELGKSNKALRKSGSLASWLRTRGGNTARQRVSAPRRTPGSRGRAVRVGAARSGHGTAGTARRRGGPQRCSAGKFRVCLLVRVPPNTCKIDLKGLVWLP